MNGWATVMPSNRSVGRPVACNLRMTPVATPFAGSVSLAACQVGHGDRATRAVIAGHRDRPGDPSDTGFGLDVVPEVAMLLITPLASESPAALAYPPFRPVPASLTMPCADAVVLRWSAQRCANEPAGG